MKDANDKDLLQYFFHKEVSDLLERSLRFFWYFERISYLNNLREETKKHKVKIPYPDHFPWSFDDQARDAIKEISESHFRNSFEYLHEAFIAENLKCYFPEDPIKNVSWSLFEAEGVADRRKPTDLTNTASFIALSLDFRCLSILYENFDQVHERLRKEISIWELFDALRNYKARLIDDSNELWIVWKTKIEGNLKRLSKSRDSIEKLKTERKKQILDAYNESTASKFKWSAHRSAGEIQDELRKRYVDRKAPSLNTIKKYLREILSAKR